MTVFLDTNVLIYAQEAGAKGDAARTVLATGGIVSVQVLNEFASVCLRKLGKSRTEIDEALADILALVPEPIPLTLDIHVAARRLASDHGLQFYDALIVAAAAEAGCDTLLSEDLQTGRRIGRVLIQNPFL